MPIWPSSPDAYICLSTGLPHRCPTDTPNVQCPALNFLTQCHHNDHLTTQLTNPASPHECATSLVAPMWQWLLPHDRKLGIIPILPSSPHLTISLSSVHFPSISVLSVSSCLQYSSLWKLPSLTWNLDDSFLTGLLLSQFCPLLNHLLQCSQIPLYYIK